MKIDIHYKPWLAAAGDDSRPVLTMCLVKDQTLYATNGFALGVFPVEMDDGDVPGLVPASLLKAAFSKTKKRAGTAEYRLLLGEDTVTYFPSFETAPRWPEEGARLWEFPDVDKLLTQVIYANPADVGQLAFSPKLVNEMTEALGISPVRLTNLGRHKPFLLEPAQPRESLGAARIPRLPFAYVMPVHDK